MTGEEKGAVTAMLIGSLGMAALGYALLAWNANIARAQRERLGFGARWTP